MGVHKTTNFVENATWTLAIALVVLSIASHYCTPETQNTDAVVTEMKVALPSVPAAAPALDINAEAPAVETQN